MNDDTQTQEKTNTGKAPYQDALEALQEKENQLEGLANRLRERFFMDYTDEQRRMFRAQEEEAIAQTEARQAEVRKIRLLVEAMARVAPEEAE